MGINTAKQAQGKIMTTAQEYNHIRELTPAQLIDYVKSRGCPTDNALAEALWHALSGNRYRLYVPSQATKMYQLLGYDPHSGFPLKRKVCNEQKVQQTA